MIIGLVSDFLPECKSKIRFGLFIHNAGTFGVKVLSMFLKLIFADSRTGKVLTPKDLIKFGLVCFHKDLCIWAERSHHELDLNYFQQF